MGKFGLKSKTILLAIGMFGVGAWAPGIPDFIRAIIITNAIANIGLRTVTKTPIFWKKP
jgi:hypothetical protein